MEFEFVPATRQGSKLRLALDGPSGSGKTYTILAVATAMASVTGGKIGLIDTERQSAGLYSPPFRFLHQKWTGPYEPQRLIRCLAEAAEQKIEYLCLDTWSRFWGGTGGMLEQVDHASKHGLSGWKTMRPVENDMIEAMLAYPGHLLVTMRVKTAYETGKDDNGKATIQKIGLQPEQRQGMEYEFSIVGDMDQDNKLTIAKSRCIELSGRTFTKPGADIAAIIIDWLATCETRRTAIDYRDAAMAPGVTFAQIRQLHADARADDQLAAAIIDPSSMDLTNLGDFLHQRGLDVRAAELAAAGQSAVKAVPDEAASATITPTPVAVPTSPAAAAAWLADVKARIPKLANRDEATSLWTDIEAMVKAGGCTVPQQKALGKLIEARLRSLAPADPAADGQAAA